MSKSRYSKTKAAGQLREAVRAAGAFSACREPGDAKGEEAWSR